MAEGQTGPKPPNVRGHEPDAERWPQSSISDKPKSIRALDAASARLAGDGYRIWGRAPYNTENQMAKRSTKVQFVGIDVSAKTLQVAVGGPSGVRDLEIANDAVGHQKLCKLLTKKRFAARVCLEATGTYSLDAAIALSAAEGVEVMIVNPKSARHFAEAQLRRAKTDRVDARALMDYAQRMPFVVWARPSRERLHLRQIARRISSLIEEATAERNRRAAALATGETPKLVLCDIDEGIAQLERRVDKLEAAALELIAGAPDLTRLLRVVTSIKGIAERSAIRLLGELLMLPADMSPREVVAHAGLDPRPRQSGARDAKRQISRVGNGRLRRPCSSRPWSPRVLSPLCARSTSAWSSGTSSRWSPPSPSCGACSSRCG